ncbi:MAG: ABC transporter permease [Ruminococcaceae bacterium]|nr:ABC transporter permease [Oscillospiraceae bacterium]
MNALKKITGYHNFGLILGIAGLLIIAAFLTPSMFSLTTAHNMLQNNSVYALLSIGMMFVLLTGGIDLSVASTLGLSGVSASLLMDNFNEVPAIVWLIASVVIGALCGFVNGLLIGKLKMIPLIATLGTMYIYRGIAFLISNGVWVFPHRFTEDYKAFAQGKIFGIYNIIWITVIVYIIVAFFLGYTKSGRYIYAVGTNENSAKIAGINPSNVKVLAYTLCGAVAGLAGMLFTANYALCSSQIGTGFEMQAIAICILGGVSINGGRGRVDGVVIGVIIMSIISNFISMLPGFSVWQDAIRGIIIIIAVAINLITGKMIENNALKERDALI